MNKYTMSNPVEELMNKEKKIAQTMPEIASNLIEFVMIENRCSYSRAKAILLRELYTLEKPKRRLI